ncbi:MAG: carboxypeptidase regulatory-like domain-containing protein [Rhodothermia bacterium]|nr:MAG: carboxypeptidase regulatory-like domain-containing protein [Rhodothermia bacterium]
MLRGFVNDDENAESLMGVNVVLTSPDGKFYGASSDFEGLYVIASLPAGRYFFSATFIGYETRLDTLVFGAGEIRTYNFSLAFETHELDEVVVEAVRDGAGAAAVVAGLQTIRPRDIDLIPAPDVSGDLVNYLTTLPGVVAVGDQGGQFFVRGGEPTQNLVLLDGILIYQPFHLIGFYSAFPSNVINVTDVYAGGFGARFGGRLSSVINVATRNGNKRRFEGDISAAPFVSAARIEGPIIRNRISLIFSGRMSVIDQGVEKLIDTPLPYSFSDVFGKIHANLSANSQVSFTGLQTYDRGTIDPVGAADTLSSSDQVIWRNKAFGTRFLLLPTSLPVQAEIILSTSEIENTFGQEIDPARKSKASRFNFSANMTHFTAKSNVDWGLFLSSIRLESELGGAFQSISTNVENVTEVGAYIETEIGDPDKIRFRPGIRVASFPSNGVSFLEPRARLVYDVGVHRFSAAWGLYHQEVVGLTDRRDAGDVFTAWTVSPKESVPAAMHAIAGYQIRPVPALRIALEAYYKKLSNLSIARWSAFPQFTTTFQSADGEVLGFDARVELDTGIFYGFVNFGHSKVEYVAQQSEIQFWFGTRELTFSPPHDRRHQLNALASFATYGFTLGIRFQYGSGLPFSRAVGFDEFVLTDGPTDVFEEEGTTRVLYGQPYDGRLPSYHRLDISLDKSFTFVGGTRLVVQGGVTNVYDRTNLFYVDLFTLRSLDQLPLIPSFGVKFEF